MSFKVMPIVLYCLLQHELMPSAFDRFLHMQVTPLFQEVLDISTEDMSVIQAAAMTAVAIVQLVSVRPLVQAYLDSGLTQWHRLKHGATSSKKVGDRIQAQLHLIHILFVKVKYSSATIPSVAYFPICIALMKW